MAAGRPEGHRRLARHLHHDLEGGRTDLTPPPELHAHAPRLPDLRPNVGAIGRLVTSTTRARSTHMASSKERHEQSTAVRHCLPLLPGNVPLARSGSDT